MQTTVFKLKLKKLSKQKEQRLLELQSVFSDCARFHLERVIALNSTSPTQIHKDCYKEARQRFNLTGQMTQTARDRAIAVYRLYKSKLRSGKKQSVPSFKGTVNIKIPVEGMRVSLERKAFRISTKTGFLWLPLEIPDNIAKQVHIEEIAISEVCKRGSDWYLMLAVSRRTPVCSAGKPRFGLDLGVKNIAVLHGPHTTKFFSAGKLNHTRKRYREYRAAIQKKKKMSMLRRSKGKESNFARNENHKISKEIVDIVSAADGVLYIENLRGIRERINKQRKNKEFRTSINCWSFSQLVTFIKYKANLAGVLVVEVDPRKTSQTCSNCGYANPKNRKTQDKFKCLSCGFQINADLNAARVIAAGGACAFSKGEVTSPSLEQSKRNGATCCDSDITARDNHNLESS